MNNSIPTRRVGTMVAEAVKTHAMPIPERPARRRVNLTHMPISRMVSPRTPIMVSGPPDLPPTPENIPLDRAHPMVHVVLWKWSQPGFRETYTSANANVVAVQIKRNLGKLPHRIVMITDEPWGLNDEVMTVYPLWQDHDEVANASGQHLPSCYRRLKLFDPTTQAELGIKPGDRIIWIDLDAVITGSLQGIVSRRERFVGWEVPGTYHPRVFNGSLVSFTAGDLEHIWTKFDPKVSPKHCFKNGFLGSDQGWLSYNLARSTEAHGLKFPIISSYPREVRRMRSVHPDARIVFFHGNRKPWHPHVLNESPWIKRFWPA